MRNILIGGRGRAALLALLAGLSWGPILRADEATLADGQVLKGKLVLDNGRFHFVPAHAQESIRLDRVRHVNFPAPPNRPVPGGTWHRLTLVDGRTLTGEILDFDESELRFRPTWTDSLRIPRAAVASLTQLPGYLTFFDEDFESGLTAWKTTGKPAPSASRKVSGRQSLLLAATGQSIEHPLIEAQEGGRLSLNFLEGNDTADGHWLVEMEFGDASVRRALRVVVGGGAERYAVESTFTGAKAYPVRRTPGWHRLTVEFTEKTLAATIDEALLWASMTVGPGAPLRKVRLACTSGPARRGPLSGVFFDDLTLARAVPPCPHRLADVTQDEIWLRRGDQILGTILRADRRTIEMRSRFGRRVWSWGEVRGIFPRQQSFSQRTAEGERVEVILRTGVSSEPDRIAAQVRSFDGEHLALTDPILGDLRIDRARIRRLRWLFFGRRIELSWSWHLLGPTGKLIPTLIPPRAEGTSLSRKLRLDEEPAPARLLVEVVQLKGPADGIGAALDRKELRAEVVVNGEAIDYLNRHVRKSSTVPRWLTIAVPREALHRGSNSIQIRLTPEAKTSHFEPCGIRAIIVEIPR